MREVAVHLQDELGAVGERAVEACDVGAARALLASRWRTETHGELGREPVGELARPVRRAVVDDEHAAVLRQHVAERTHHRLEVLELVVGGEADGGAHVLIIAVWRDPPPQRDVADQFDLLADLLEIEGADAFRVVAYRRAATVMRETPAGIAQIALDGKAKSLTGIGKTIEEKIVQIVEEGEIEALRERKERIPTEVVSFMRLPGLGPKTARRIWQELGISTSRS